MANEAEEKLARGELDDYAAAEAVRDGLLPSPTQFGEFWLFALRVTGTGAAWRDSIEEYAYREKKLWTSPDFLKRASSIPITWGHPEKSGLTSDEYRERSIGNAVLSYVDGDSVWCVAKIFDADSSKLMQEGSFRSTSPGITTSKGSVSSVSDTGATVLVEALPLTVDHLAICEQGVWDTGGPPAGIRIDAITKEQKSSMTPEEEAKLKQERDDAIKRADAAEAKERERADKAKKDEEAENERANVEKAEKEKADRKARHDAPRQDGESEEAWDKRKADARKDETAEEKKEREEREKLAEIEDKKKKDAAAATETVNANVDELQDARRADSKRLEALEAEIARLKKQPTMDDANAIATAYHRYDSIYQMLGERVPQHMPGESPIAYRRRLADGLRKHTRTWKEQVIHDAVAGPAFDIIEQNVIDEALAEAKHPTRTDANAGRLIERTTTQNGKTRTEFYGDSAVAYAPFESPVMSFKFKKPSATSAR